MKTLRVRIMPRGIAFGIPLDGNLLATSEQMAAVYSHFFVLILHELETENLKTGHAEATLDIYK